MKNVAEMLHDEIKASMEFSNKNFGLMTGDGFREMVEDLTKDEPFCALMLLHMLAVGMNGADVTKSMKQLGSSQVGEVIKSNLEVFKMPLEALYWGIQIGRKLEKAEIEALEKMAREMPSN